jgi:2C-methyl-D-erythritol 2,4-cyclodiphosphate synthase
VIVKFNRNSRGADADLRESYRQRLNEIFEAGKSNGGGGSVPAPSPSLMPPVTEQDLEPLVLVRTEEPAAPCAEIRQPPPEKAAAPEATPRLVEEETPPADVFSKAAERVTQSMVEFWTSVMQSLDSRRQEEEARLQAACEDLKRVQGEVAELREQIAARERGMEAQVAEVLGRIEQRLERLDKGVQSQARAIADLGAAGERRDQAQHALQQRLDAQAEAVRDLNNAFGAQQSRWSQYRSAVERLREITDVPGLPVQLPENL